MDKVCGNHPESLALATCKACDKAICLMCVHDEREGTFCSESCVRAFRDGVPVTSAAEAQAAAPPADAAQAAASSVWEDMPAADAAPAEEAPPPPEEPPAEPERPSRETKAVPASTKSIGNPCWQHADIRAKAFCAACKRPICGLCIVENAAGLFCSDACAKGLRGRKGLGAGAKVAIVLVVLVVAAGAAVAVKPELLDQVKALAGMGPDVQPPPPPIAVHPTTPPVVPPKPSTNPNPASPPVGTTPKPPPPPVKPPTPAPTPKPAPPPVPRPIPPPAPRPARPEPPKPTRMVNPWQAEAPGAWYRVQTVENGKTTLTDIGLKARDAVSYTLQMQDAGGAVREARTEILPVEILGEERLQIEDRSWTCEVRGVRKADGSYQRSWVLMQSRHAGAVLQEDTPAGRRYPVRLWENPVRVGLRNYDCLVIESEIEASGKRSKVWYSPAYPLGVVKLENDRGGSVLVDSGDAWESRPPLK